MTTDATNGQAARTPRSRRGYWIPGLIAIVVLVVIAVAVGAGDLSHPAPNSLAQSDIESQLSLGIQTEQRASEPPTVRCPGPEPVRKGHRFDCVVDRAGTATVVSVTEIDDRGGLRWAMAGSPP
jgi:Domain of unknown function (DUF4333)